MIQEFEFSGAGREVNAKGVTFFYSEGRAQGETTRLRVRADGMECGQIEPGDTVILTGSASRWELVPVSALCAGKVRIGQSDFRSSRVAGSVKIDRDDYAPTLANRAFIRAVETIPTIATVSEWHLSNPVGSGRVLVVSRIWARSSFNVPVWGWIEASAAFNTNMLGAANATNKNNGAAYDLTAVGRIMTRSVPRAVWAVPAGVVYLTGPQSDLGRPAELAPPVVLQPGTGLTIAPGVVAGSATGWLSSVEWTEVLATEI